MADILSQDEIDALLSTVIEDHEWPVYIYRNRSEIITLYKDSEYISALLETGDDITDYSIISLFEKKYMDNTIKLYLNKKSIATYFIHVLYSKDTDYAYTNILDEEKEFMKQWLIDTPEYNL